MKVDTGDKNYLNYKITLLLHPKISRKNSMTSDSCSKIVSGGEKTSMFFPPPPAIFEHQSHVIEFFHHFLGRDNRVIKGFKFFISPVSTLINTFQGTLKYQKFLRNRQNKHKLSKLANIERYKHFMENHPWDQKLCKGPKEPFHTLRIVFRVVGDCERH